MDYKYKIGWCPYCNQGWVEIKKDSIQEKLILVCSECDTVWENPNDFINHRPKQNYMFKEVLQEPTYEEISKLEWTSYLINENLNDVSESGGTVTD